MTLSAVALPSFMSAASFCIESWTWPGLNIIFYFTGLLHFSTCIHPIAIVPCPEIITTFCTVFKSVFFLSMLCECRCWRWRQRTDSRRWWREDKVMTQQNSTRLLFKAHISIRVQFLRTSSEWLTHLFSECVPRYWVRLMPQHVAAGINFMFKDCVIACFVRSIA